MRILPILFNTEIVMRLQADMKTVTRRVIKYSASDVYKSACFHGRWWGGMTVDNMSQSLIDWYCKEVKRPPYEPGDILYVRETWAESAEGYAYKADFDGAEGWGWRPSIHMPKEAARIFLKVKAVRVERLQDSFFAPISPIFELLAEGMDIGDDCRNCIATYGNPCCVDTVDEDGSNLYGGDCGILDVVRGEFSELWDSTIKPADRDKYGWGANPWVWVIEFERTDKPEGWPSFEEVVPR